MDLLSVAVHMQFLQWLSSYSALAVASVMQKRGTRYRLGYARARRFIGNAYAWSSKNARYSWESIAPSFFGPEVLSNAHTHTHVQIAAQANVLQVR